VIEFQVVGACDRDRTGDPVLAKPDNRLQRLRSFSLTTNDYNKSGNLLFAQAELQSIENDAFLHSSCTAAISERTCTVNPSRVNTSAFYKGESQEKKLPGDWKEQRFLPGSPAHVMLGGSWGFLFSQSHVVVVTTPSVSDATSSTVAKIANHSSI
jgi:hypothetical protein